MHARATTIGIGHPLLEQDADLDALGQHLDETQALELVLAVATANWTHRVNDGLRTPMPD